MSVNNSKIEKSFLRKLIGKMPVQSNYQVRWKNFKGFSDSGWIEIKPITIIIGNNNSGKTSFLAPILLMSQTIISIDGISPLVVSGNTFDGGNIQELINNYDLTKDFSFGFKYIIAKAENKLKKIGDYPPGGVEITFGIDNKADKELYVKSQKIFDIYSREYLKINRDVFSKYRFTGSTIKGLTNDEKKAIRNATPLNFLFSPNSFLSQLTNFESSKNKINFSESFSELLKISAANFSVFREILGKVSYIGPIRDNPKRYYEFKNENYHNVGSKGQNVPDLIKKHEKKIKNQLNYWVKKFEFGDTLELHKLSNSIGCLAFRRNGEETYTNIANSGFGASQILPLIIQALVSEPETLTIAEQPEIHLNPKLQGVLAELFSLMIEKKQRILVETHSEHLLLRLRTLIAKGKIKKENIAIYFVEKVGSESKIRPITIDDNGHIPPTEWPNGFFEDTLNESIDLAIAQSETKK